jgi:hypothetical protein
MPVNKLIFKDAEKARDAITASQKKEIAKLYENWAAEIGERAKYYSHKFAPSYAVAERQMKELMKQMEATSHEVANEIYTGVKKNIYLVADSVVQQNVEWLKSLGFAGDTLDAAFNYVPDEIVRNIITGQIYDSGWSLSKRIWSDNEDTMKTAYQIVAGGMAQNKSIYEIAKDLESYVEPGAKKPWNLTMKDGRKIYPKQVDYNAQRLARTLVQHGYQQSFKATTEKNPFIEAYKWNANGSRVCDLCMERETTNIHGLGPGIYPKNQMSMDHPNGMCTMEPVVVDNLVDQLADWFNSPDGTYPEIDAFAGNFGYEGVPAKSVSKIVLPTEEEISAVKEYTTGSYNGINGYLRNGYAINKEVVKSLVENIDNFIEKSPEVKTSLTVFRGTRPEELGFSGKLNEASAESLERTLKREGLINKGFLSTSTEELDAYNNGVIMNIKIEEGAKAANISKLSNVEWEKEVLLPRDVKLDVESVVYDKKKKSFVVTAIYK